VAFAVILKPQGIFLIPILGFAWLRQLIWNREKSVGRKIGSFFGILGAFAGTLSLIALPFGIHRGAGFFKWIVELYVGTANGYKGATVNAYNFWYLLGENWTNDSAEWLLGMTFFQWGLLFIIVICLLVGGLYLFGKMERGTPCLLAAALVLAVTMFAPRMHERYFFPAVASVWAFEALSKTKLTKKDWFYRYTWSAMLINGICFAIKKWILHTGAGALSGFAADMTPDVACNYLIMAIPLGLAIAVTAVFLSRHVQVAIEVDDATREEQNENQNAC
jgi:Gpi18-like mannosyltransferase